MHATDLPLEMLRGQITQPTLLLLHIAAGNSVLTVRSRKTGDRFTFKFRRPETPHPQRGTRPIWVNLLNGPDNETDYQFLGTIWEGQDRWTYNHSPKSRTSTQAPSVQAAAWVARHLPHAPDVLMEQAEWWHEGRCGRCGRKLTVPESVDTGFGPDCAAILGLK